MERIAGNNGESAPQTVTRSSRLSVRMSESKFYTIRPRFRIEGRECAVQNIIFYDKPEELKTVPDRSTGKRLLHTHSIKGRSAPLSVGLSCRNFDGFAVLCSFQNRLISCLQSLYKPKSICNTDINLNNYLILWLILKHNGKERAERRSRFEEMGIL